MNVQAYAKGRGAVAVWGTCWEGQGAPGYWPWIQVVCALAREDHGGDAMLATLTGANNPFFVQQTARPLARRLARLPGDVVDLLAVAAVLGKRFAAAAGSAPRRGRASRP